MIPTKCETECGACPACEAARRAMWALIEEQICNDAIAILEARGYIVRKRDAPQS